MRIASRIGLVVALSATILLAASCGLTPVKPTATPTPTVLVRPSPTPTATPTPPPATATTTAATAATTAATSAAATGFGVITADALRVRRGPGTGFDVVTMLQRGTVISVLEKQPDEQGQTWFRIAENQWVHGGYVDLYTTKSEADAASAKLSAGKH